MSHIQEYYQLLYSQSEGDKQALRQAVEEEDFLEVQNAYQIIENTGFQVVVPCPGEEKLYQEVKARYEKEGLTPALMRLAGPITVSSFQRDLVRQYCVPLYYRAWEHGGAAVETGYYLLGIPECYDRKQGIVLENVQLGMF